MMMMMMMCLPAPSQVKSRNVLAYLVVTYVVSLSSSSSVQPRVWLAGTLNVHREGETPEKIDPEHVFVVGGNRLAQAE